jgi:hypothetical protein
MSEMFNPHAPATAYDHNTTIVAVLDGILENPCRATWK